MVLRCSCYSDNILSEEARSIKWLSRGYFIFCIWLMLGYFKSGRVLLMQLYYCHSSTTVRVDCTENDSSTLHPTLQLKVASTKEGPEHNLEPRVRCRRIGPLPVSLR